jgi:hypothetical protein
MKKTLAIATAVLSFVLPVNLFASENCSFVGKFTQGQNVTKFSWSVEVTRHRGGFSLHGRTSDRYGVARVNGRCDKATDVCSFTKEYISGQSNGSMFYYAGQADNDAISGKWGYQKGSYHGGDFYAQVLNCN